jgi:hypothetical protein
MREGLLRERHVAAVQLQAAIVSGRVPDVGLMLWATVFYNFYSTRRHGWHTHTS